MDQTTPRKRKATKRRLYWENCSVCQFMKKTPAFRMRVMQSQYFEPNGHESLADVVHSFGDPVPMSTVYAHMHRHQQKDLIRAQEKYNKVAPAGDTQALTGAIEGEVMSEGQHEVGLDEFIREGREKLIRKEMPITASTYLQAIKIKADIEKSTKDRRLEAAKAFFANAKPKQPEPAGSPET